MLQTSFSGCPLAAEATPSRRPIAARSSAWAGAAARRLAGAGAGAGISPNAISVASLGASVAGAALMLHPVSWLSWVGAAACVQARLVCNLLDGMVAIEGGRATRTGALFNEVPDRLADTVLLVALGMAAGTPVLGWAAAVAAVSTAYIRLLGGALGQAQDFTGIMAKQQRMAVLTFALLAVPMGAGRAGLLAAATIITIGGLITCATRLARIAGRLARIDRNLAP